jgi:hypothetical protein
MKARLKDLKLMGHTAFFILKISSGGFYSFNLLEEFGF